MGCAPGQRQGRPATYCRTARAVPRSWRAGARGRRRAPGLAWGPQPPCHGGDVPAHSLLKTESTGCKHVGGQGVRQNRREADGRAAQRARLFSFLRTLQTCGSRLTSHTGVSLSAPRSLHSSQNGAFPLCFPTGPCRPSAVSLPAEPPQLRPRGSLRSPGRDPTLPACPSLTLKARPRAPAQQARGTAEAWTQGAGGGRHRLCACGPRVTRRLERGGPGD